MKTHQHGADIRRTALALGLAASFGAAAQGAVVQAGLTQLLRNSQLAYSKTEDDERAAKAKTRQACDASRDAYRALATANLAEAAQLSKLAADALQKRLDCGAAEQREKDSAAQLESAGRVMAEVANSLVQCAVEQATDCEKRAGNLDTQLNALVSKSKLTGLQPVDTLLAPAPKDKIKALLDEAAKAQAIVDELRASGATVYDLYDAATAAALATDLDKIKGPLRNELLAARTTAITGLSQISDLAGKTRKQVGHAQTAADHLVREALALKACSDADVSCSRRALYAATEHAEALTKIKAAVEKNVQELKDRKDKNEAIKGKPDATTAQISNAVELRRLLETNPDVKSLFGGDAIQFTAGTIGTDVVMRKTFGGDSLSNSQRFSVIVTAPLNAGGLSGLLDENDQPAAKSSLKLSWHNTRSESTLFNAYKFFDFSAGIKWTADRRSYFEPTLPTTLTKTTGRFDKWAFSAQLATLLPGDNNLSVLTVERARGWKDGAVAIRCPYQSGLDAGLVTCTDGALGAPKVDYTTKAGLEARWQYTNHAVGVKVDHDLDNNITKVDVPLYLWRDRSDDKKQPFTSGINVGWTKGVSGLKWGLFVSAPFNLSVPRQ